MRTACGERRAHWPAPVRACRARWHATPPPIGPHPCVHVAHSGARHCRPLAGTRARLSRTVAHDTAAPPVRTGRAGGRPRAHTLRTLARMAYGAVAARVRAAVHRLCGGSEAAMGRLF
ncbi:hypothetical protein F511_45731 [Dorcoceras hygrometricum]|uniref:Uncharacterized protein n=1 Tax=Dorcoceras hygrometricum TaxID=472368 RepID=A0A2Z6ZV85_9LAMI|nr:hypothetical protein F511_45731 [Dorcoceras hygrometricum]